MNIDGVLEDTDTAWTRPDDDCTESSRETVFEVVEYTNESDSDRNVDIIASYAFDGFLLVYNAEVMADAPIEGCVDGNDDGTSTANSLVLNFTVPAGETIYVAVTSFSTGRGEFNVSISDSLVRCGDGAIELDETCDDGNTEDGDGCAATCEIEETFVCAGEPSECRVPACGDGFIDDGEACDDDNEDAGDGCSATCEVEDGFLCEGEPSMCSEPVCGNDIVEVGEVCDDGNMVGGDGCEADCTSAVFTGALEDTDPQWARASAICGGGFGTKYFDIVPFTWNGTVDASLTFTASWPDHDGYLHVFEGGSMPADSLAGCIAGDDDFEGTSGSQVAGEEITAGQSLDIIMSSFGDNVTGNWVLTITRD